MGGCRCVYRKCTNTTTQLPELHYFHFPVRDPARCEQWIVNARKPSFRTLDKSKLRNKVVCSMHFEKKCFVNENHDRLIHNAVPTLGFEEDDNENGNLQGSGSLGSTDNIDIMLIPLNEDNTKFTLPDVGFSGMSYTICNDTLVPSNSLNYIKSEVKPTIKIEPGLGNIRPIIKKIKTNFPLKQAFTLTPGQGGESAKLKPCATTTYLKSPNTQTHRSEAEGTNEKNISTYSVSTVNGDVSVEPSTESYINVDKLIREYPSDPTLLNETSNQMDNISLHLKSNNEYTIQVAPPTISEIRKPENLINSDDTSQDSAKNNGLPMDVVIEDPKPREDQNSFSSTTTDKEYLRLMKSHSKQMKQLKNLVQKQSKINKLILHRKRRLPFKQRKPNKVQLLELIKPFLKPSLVAILKLELMPSDEVTLSDKEEKFITDLYTENPECYNVMKNHWGWNLPSSEKVEESKNN